MPDGSILEWDKQHGEVEKYDRSGRKHQGAYDPQTGDQVSDPASGRTTPKTSPITIPSPTDGAYVGDINGSPIVIDGKVYDHLDGDWENSIVKLNKAIDSGDLSDDLLKVAKDLRSQLQKEKDRLTGILNTAQTTRNKN